MLITGTSEIFDFFVKISTDTPWSTSNRIVQNAAQCVFSPPLGKSLNAFEKNEGVSLVDANFAPSRDDPRPLKKNWPWHPLPLVMEVSMVPNFHSLTRV